MSVIAQAVDTGDRIAAWEERAKTTPARCPDSKCAAKVIYVSAQVDGDGITRRCAHFRHVVGSGCPHGSARGGDRMTPWHSMWQSRCDDLSRIEVSVERGEIRSRADTLCRDAVTAIEYQHSGLEQAAITRRENVWRGRVIWVADSGSEDRAGEARIADGRFRWTNTAGLQRRRFRTVVLVDIGDNTLVELPRNVAPAGTELDIPQSAVRVWTHDQFVAQVVNGEELPFDFDATVWATEAREKADRERRARTDTDRTLAREKARQARVQRELAGQVCEYSGDARDRLVMPTDVEPVDGGDEPTLVKLRDPGGQDFSGVRNLTPEPTPVTGLDGKTYPPRRYRIQCAGCGDWTTTTAQQVFCDRCWSARIPQPPLSAADRAKLKGHAPAARGTRADVVTALSDLDRQARHA